MCIRNFRDINVNLCAFNAMKKLVVFFGNFEWKHHSLFIAQLIDLTRKLYDSDDGKVLFFKTLFIGGKKPNHNVSCLSSVFSFIRLLQWQYLIWVVFVYRLLDGIGNEFENSVIVLAGLGLCCLCPLRISFILNALLRSVIHSETNCSVQTLYAFARSPVCSLTSPIYLCAYTLCSLSVYLPISRCAINVKNLIICCSVQ